MKDKSIVEAQHGAGTGTDSGSPPATSAAPYRSWTWSRSRWTNHRPLSGHVTTMLASDWLLAGGGQLGGPRLPRHGAAVRAAAGRRAGGGRRPGVRLPRHETCQWNFAKLQSLLINFAHKRITSGPSPNIKKVREISLTPVPGTSAAEPSTALVVLDPSDLAELGRFTVASTTPIGFHSVWI